MSSIQDLRISEKTVISKKYEAVVKIEALETVAIVAAVNPRMPGIELYCAIQEFISELRKEAGLE